MTTHQSIESATSYLGEAFVCSKMDDSFISQLRDQTGLDHILLIEEIPVSTSITGGVASLESILSSTVTLDLPPIVVPQSKIARHAESGE